MKNSYLIVGSGLFGSLFAYEANKKGKKCLVVDKRSHVGGNIYTENIEGIKAFRGSKYVQSLIGESFIQTKNFRNLAI